MNNSQAKEAATYFKSKKGFNSLFVLFSKKYQSLGRIGGSVLIKNAALEEKNDIGRFLGEDFSREQDLKVSMLKFEKALEDTKFNGASLLNVLEFYNGEKLVSNKEEAENKEKEQKEFLQFFHDRNKNKIQLIWINAISEKRKGTQQIYTLYNQDKHKLKNAFKHVFNALGKLPLTDYQRLPIFASAITSDPHYFDIGDYGGKLLISALQIILNETENKEIVPSPNAEQVTEILDCFGIMRDDVNNYVNVYGVKGYDAYKNPDILLEMAYNQNRVLNIPLREMHALDKIEAVNDTIFVVENSGLFSSLVDMLIEQNVKATIVCSNGQMRLATVMLFRKSKARIFYSGDYDPEGIVIAKGLKNKFGDRVQYWRYGPEDYLCSLSNIEMDKTRMAKLDNIVDTELSAIIHELKKHKRSGYQEEQIHNLFQDIRNNIDYTYIKMLN